MYLVIELQTDSDGKMAHLETVHETLAEAESKFHLILSSAAVSNVHFHSAAIIDACGNLLGSRFYEH